jgi:hypothetical protein
MEAPMQQQITYSPARIVAVSALGVLVCVVLPLAGFFLVPDASFWPLDGNHNSGPSALGVAILALGVVVPLLVLWWLGHRQLQRDLPLLCVGLLLLYGTFVMWPTYAGRHTVVVMTPTGTGEYDPEEDIAYDLWYSDLVEFAQPDYRENWLVSVIITGCFLITGGTLITGWYILVPLGFVTLLTLGRRWPQMRGRTRWLRLGVSLLAIVLPLLTWSATSRFWIWLLD